MQENQLVGSVNWTGSTVETAVVTETKEVLTDTVKLGYIKALIDENVDTLRKHKDVYAVYNDTDLGSIITRMEQNIIQLRKMEYSLTD
jgi:hypothetical protein